MEGTIWEIFCSLSVAIFIRCCLNSTSRTHGWLLAEVYFVVMLFADTVYSLPFTFKHRISAQHISWGRKEFLFIVYCFNVDIKIKITTYSMWWFLVKMLDHCLTGGGDNHDNNSRRRQHNKNNNSNNSQCQFTRNTYSKKTHPYSWLSAPLSSCRLEVFT